MSQLKFGLLIEVDEHIAYGVEVGWSFLYKVNLDTLESEYVGRFEGEKLATYCLFSKGCCIDGMLYFAPKAAKYLWTYDINANTMERYECHETIQGDSKFFDIIQYNNKLYYFATESLTVVEVDQETNNMRVISSDCEQLNVFFRAGVQIKDEYYCCSHGAVLFKYNFITEHFERIKISDSYRGATSICNVGNDVWIFPRFYGDPFVVWNIESNTYTEIDNPYMADAKNDKLSYIYARYYKGKIYAFSTMNAPSVMVDPQNYDFQIIRELPCEENLKTGMYAILEDGIILGTVGREGSFYYDKIRLFMYRFSDESIVEIEFKDKRKKDTDKKIVNYVLKNGIVKEGKRFGISEFINFID